MIFLDEINNKHPLKEEITATNPCVTKDSWILTSEGPKQVKDLVCRHFYAVINGKKYGSNGFFKTGVKDTYLLKTKEGFETKLTSDHKVQKITKLTRYIMKTEWCEASRLRKNDMILLNNHKNFRWQGKYSLEEGYLVGLLMGDGTVQKDKTLLGSWTDSKGAESVRHFVFKYLSMFPHREDFKGWQNYPDRKHYRMTTGYLKKLCQELGLKQRKKHITEQIEKASYEFCIGFLRGFFDADGSVQGSQKKGVSVRLAQSNLETLKVVQRMLLRMGIYSTIYKNRRRASKRLLPDGKGGKKEYPTKSQHELIISRENLTYFQKIGFHDEDKQKRLGNALKAHQRKLNRELFIAHVDRLSKSSKEEVYDVHIPEKNSFDANGFVVHNCGEQPLLDYESCNLGSINLGNFVKNGKIEEERLRKTVRKAVVLLDNIIELNKFPFREIEEKTIANRKIGLGIMGWAEMLIQLGIAYDSDKALETAEHIMRLINSEARKMSEELGKKRGNFPNLRKSKLTSKYLRNATVTTIAPTGTISIIADCSSGIEPLFAVSYVRNVMEGTRLLETNKYFEQIAKKKGFYSKELMQRISKKGTIQHFKEIPNDVKRIFKTALDIKPEWHVKMQASFQKHTDNGVSKTVNLPRNATKEDVRKIFLLAHKLKCKGTTVYRYGSKKNQVLSFGKEVRAESEYEGGCPTTYCPY